MEITQIIPHVEALIFAADRPLPAIELVELLNGALGFLEDKATLDQVETALEAIREKYQSEFYAFEVRQSGGGYQFLTKPDYYRTVAALNGDKYLKKLSTAALETLAIIAYKQPVSKGEIEAIRGVSSDYSIQKLLEKELILISGRSEELPGKPLLYAVSRSFMDYFGINSPEDLPKIKEVLTPGETEPSAPAMNGSREAAEEIAPEEEEVRFLVSENGTLTVIETEEPAPPGETPATEEAPAEAEEAPPAEEETETPAEEEVHPTEDEVPAEEETPPAEEEVAPTEETPPAEEEVAPTEETPPAEEETPPAGEEGGEGDSQQDNEDERKD